MALTNILHVYGQRAWRDDVVIAGDREALTNLRAAIDWALRSAPDAPCPRPEGHARIESFVNDGAGFGVHVALLNGETANRLQAPYTADYAAGTGRGLDVWTLLMQRGWLREEAGGG